MLNNNHGEASGQSSDDEPPSIALHEEGGRAIYALTGTWTTRTVATMDAEMRGLEAKSDKPVVVDVSGITRLDTAGAWLVERLIEATEARNHPVEISGKSEVSTILLDAVSAASRGKEQAPAVARVNPVVRMLEAIGKNMVNGVLELRSAMFILGSTIRGGQMKLGRGHAVNVTAVVHQIDRMGVGAIPVVCLMSAIVGGIVAQQGAFQLRYFGAEIFVVDLVGILILRELGVLMTAIMVAGRTGSAITAEIGSMKMREEVDALTVIGLNPIGVLVFPRLLALMIAVPCLTIIANFAALGGAMALTWYYSGIPPEQFIDRLRASIDLSTIFSGLIKAPFMALIIGIIAAQEGLNVEGSAESLGRRVTASVVKSIFVVIVVDGFFAIFYAAISF